MSTVISIRSEKDGDRVRVSVESSDTLKKTMNDVCSYWSLEGSHSLELNGTELSPHMRWSDVSLDEDDELIIKPSQNDKILPNDLWEKRVNNEVEGLRSKGIEVSTDRCEERYHMDIWLKEIPGPVKIGDMVATSFKHRISISLTRSYPYVPPTVLWKTPIYHPNIAPPETGGNVSCTYISNWDFSRNIPDLIDELIRLLDHPQKEHVLDVRECIEASRKT